MNFIYSCAFILHLRDIYELSIDLLPVGLIAQLVRALHRYCRGHGSDSRSSLNFFLPLPFLNLFIALFLSFLSALLLSLPFAFHILSGCRKKLGVDLWARPGNRLDQL